jgi:hypothetical protein
LIIIFFIFTETEETKNGKKTQGERTMADPNGTPKEEATQEEAAQAPVQAMQAPVQAMQAASEPLLPEVPDDESFLEVLKTAGVQLPGDVDVIAGIKACLADDAGLFDLPATLLALIERTAESLNEPVDGQKIVELHELVNKRNYADILAVVNCQGAASFVNKTRRKNLLSKVRGILFPALVEFHESMESFRESIRDGLGTDVALGMMTGMMTPEMQSIAMSPPDIEDLKNAAESLVVKVNQTFAGWGQASSRVLANDAMSIKKALDHDDLPVYTGFQNREQMMAGLGIDVTANDVNQERNLAQYTLAVLHLNRGVDADKEMRLITALALMDNKIKWERLT